MTYNILEWPLHYQCTVIIITQLVYATIRTINIQSTVAGSILYNSMTNFGITLTWLVSLSLGLKGIHEGNFYLMGSYICGATFGGVPILMYQGRPFFNRK